MSTKPKQQTSGTKAARAKRDLGTLAPFNYDTVATASKIGNAVARKAQMRWEGAGKAFPLARWDYAETVTSAILEGVALGYDTTAAIKHGCQVGNANLRKMSHYDTTAPEDLHWLPQVSDDTQGEGAGVYALRLAVANRARVLRARAFVIYDKAKAEKRRGNPRAALRSDLAWIRRATRYMAAQMDGKGYSLRMAAGVSPAGKRGGKAKDERSQWKDMLRSHARTMTRLGILTVS
jgi:hypothetical protein